MPSKKRKVLVIDDSDVILQSLISFFSEYDIDVLTATNGLDGIKLAAEHHPDVIFLDLVMPNVNGLKMLEVKKALDEIRSIPVIVISANTGRSNVVSAMELGADRIISKPIDHEMLKRYVNEILGENIFGSPKKTTKISDNESKEIKEQLVSFFLNSFPVKQKGIQEAIRTRDGARLKEILHEIKGAGGTIGYDEITKISADVEGRELATPTDWVYAEFKCNQIFQIVNQIKNNFINK